MASNPLFEQHEYLVQYFKNMIVKFLNLPKCSSKRSIFAPYSQGGLNITKPSAHILRNIFNWSAKHFTFTRDKYFFNLCSVVSTKLNIEIVHNSPYPFYYRTTPTPPNFDPNFYGIYTDGSFTQKGSAACTTIVSNQLTISLIEKLPHLPAFYSEIRAISNVTKLLKNSDLPIMLDNNKTKIFSDCQTAIHIYNMSKISDPPISQFYFEKLNIAFISRLDIPIFKIKGHANFYGNETANDLAIEAANNIRIATPPIQITVIANI